MINLGNGKYRSLEEINNALRLQELVKKRTNELRTIYNNFPTEVKTVQYRILQSLVKESEQ